MTAGPGAAELDRTLTLLGTDLALDFPGAAGGWEDADLAVQPAEGRLPATVDLAVAGRLRAADQMLVNRLKATRGELAALGHPEYGSRHHELIGEPNVERTRNLVKLHVLEALSHEPRLAEVVDCAVRAAHDPPRDVVRVELTVLLWREPQPRNLVVPFSLAGDPADGDAGTGGTGGNAP